MKIESIRINRKYLDEQELEHATFLDEQIDMQATGLANKVLEKYPAAAWGDIAQFAEAHALIQMPFNLHLLFQFLKLRAEGAELMEQAEGDTDSLEWAQGQAIIRASDALAAYMEHDQPPEDTCECPTCRSRRAYEDISGTKAPKTADIMVVPEGTEEFAGLIIDENTPEYVKKNAIPAEISHTWRCVACRTIQDVDDECKCGGTEFVPVVVLDVPSAELVAQHEINTALKDPATPACKKVVH